MNKKIFLLLPAIFSTALWAGIFNRQDNVYLDIGKSHLSQAMQINHSGKLATNYTVLDATEYRQTFKVTRYKLRKLLTDLQKNHYPNANERFAFISKQLLDIPYLFTGATGEGDWQSNSSVYQPGGVHVKQDPVYRLDGFDCQTFVQVVMALLYSHDLDEFDQNIIKISYGAAGNLGSKKIHYYNRNNFVDGDWNPINQRNGWIADETSQGELASHAKKTSLNITRQNWFLFQQKKLNTTVRVLNEMNGDFMAKRFMTDYANLNYPRFDSEKISIAYLPKEKLAIQQSDGIYQPNHALFDKISTPAVIELVRDVKKWNIGNKNVKDVIGSELNISHMGFLYRKNFHYGEVIFQKTTCDYDPQHQKVCVVTPIICQKKKCNELMFSHATDARPNGYYWYKKEDGNYTCSSILPSTKTSYTFCNRVVEEPLFDYLTSYQYGSYLYMVNPSIIGVHLEKLVDKN